MKKFALLMAATMALGCSQAEPEMPETVAKSFAEAFCNYNFERAEKYCTEEGRRILVFKASNTTQEELDSYNAQTGNVTAEVSDVTLSVDSLARVAVCSSSGDSFSLELVLREGHWLVKAISY